MRYVCIEVGNVIIGSHGSLTLNKIYNDTLKKYDSQGVSSIRIKDDDGNLYFYPSRLFKPIDEIRSKKLESIGI